MRRREPPRSRRDDQTKSRMQSQHQYLVSNRILNHVKIIMLLYHIQGRLLHDFGRILIIIHLWIIVGCICSHIIFNILLYIQIMHCHEYRLLLAIIWSSKMLIAARRKRRARSKTQSIYSPGGVPQACLMLRSGGGNVCARRRQWSNK